MKICLKCNKEFNNRVIIDGKERVINKRKYCLKCSPFGMKNTKRLHLPQRDSNSKKNCIECGRDFKWTKNNVCPTCRSLKRRKLHRIKAIEYCGGRCSNCGNNDSDVLTFHHTNPRTKKFTLCSNWQKKWDTIVEELNKCEILCANCHMKLHRKNDE
jgi:hypothetical protein